MSRSLNKDKKYHIIYKTINLLTEKYYIGMHSTDDLEDGYLGSGKRLTYSLRKYGKENHIREILEFCDSREELNFREAEIINMNEISKNECMNLKVGGQYSSGMIGKTQSLTAKQKISKAHKGRIFTNEWKQKISSSLIGRKTSDETKEKQKNASIGNKHAAGYKPTEESNEARRLKMKGRKNGPQDKITCPHCSKTGAVSGMKHWHFDRCKHKPKTK
jgi:hypothetical protein